jgi:uncharacterized protein YbaP (TraB family)
MNIVHRVYHFLRYTLGLVLSLLVPGLIVAQTETAPASAPTAVFQPPTTQDTSLLWEITGDGIAAPSYLFGTIHLIPREDYFLPATVVRAINDSEEVLFEIDPRDMQDPTAMMGLMGKINMRGDTTLSDLLPAERYDTVAAYFEQSGMPMFFLQRMKPLFLSSMVGMDMTGGNPLAGGDSKMQSYEFELSEIAEAAGKEIGGLETMEFQLGLFDSIPYTVQAEMLYESVIGEMDKDMPGSGGQFAEMVDLYRRKAVADMSQMITDESAGKGNFEELLVIRRNENWVPIIADRLASTPTVYAVGAGHLGGERGVIALLRAAGFSVEPVYRLSE